MTNADHEPVMLREVLEYLESGPGRTIVDATFGAGGHSKALLESGARVIAMDQDPGAAEYLQRLEVPGLRFVAGNFRHLGKHLGDLGVDTVDGLLADLGVSSMQLDQAQRGFAFRQEGPLDMRMGGEGESAADVVNDYEQEQLAEIIFRYGEERHSRRIARAIGSARQRAPILTTERLAQVVASAYPPGRRREHPARRTFQALRIYVNDELGALEELLREVPGHLDHGGRVVILSYHSLEDRIVKRAFRDDARLEPLTKRPLTATEDETARNPRARSAKLRAAQRRAE